MTSSGSSKSAIELSANFHRLRVQDIIVYTFRLRRHVLNVRHIILSGLGIYLGLSLLSGWGSLPDPLCCGCSSAGLFELGGPSEWAGSLERIGLEISSLVAEYSAVFRL